MERCARGRGQVLVEDRVVDDGGRRRSELPNAGKPSAMSPCVDRRRDSAREALSRLSSARSAPSGPPRRRRGARASLLHGGVDRPTIAAATLRDVEPGPHLGWRVAPQALEVHGAVVWSGGGAAAPEAEVVAAQVQPRARPDLEEAQGKPVAAASKKPKARAAARPTSLVWQGRATSGTEAVDPFGHEVAHGPPGAAGRPAPRRPGAGCPGNWAARTGARPSRARRWRAAISRRPRASPRGPGAGSSCEQGLRGPAPRPRPRPRASAPPRRAATPWPRSAGPGRGAAPPYARARARAGLGPVRFHYNVAGGAPGERGRTRTTAMGLAGCAGGPALRASPPVRRKRHRARARAST